MNPQTSVTQSAFDVNSIAYALARNECGEKLNILLALEAAGINRDSPGLKNFLTSEAFKAKYAAYVRELKESGESFKLKARVQAEELLATQWSIIHDKDAPATVRMQGIQNVVEWADLKPKKASAESAAPPAITIHIDLGGEKPQVIDVTPSPVKEISE